MSAPTSWHIRGDVLEACSCETACPCNFGSNPTQLPCEAALGWHIQEGQYGETRLDGLNVVLYLRIPGYAFDGNWTVGAYIDERADPQQVEALGSIFSGQAGGWPAVVSGLITQYLEPKQVAIQFEKIDGEYQFIVPGLLEVASERVPSPLPGEPPLDSKVRDLAVPFYTGEVSVRRSRTLTLTDPNMSFTYTGLSSFIGAFDYSGP